MYFVGVVEIAAGILVALAPRMGAYVVAAWLGGIIVNLLTADAPTYYDIALRDFGLLLAALTLGRLAQAFHAAPSISAAPPRGCATQREQPLPRPGPPPVADRPSRYRMCEENKSEFPRLLAAGRN